MLVSYNWLKEYFADSLPEPKDLVESLTKHAFEIEDLYSQGEDWVIDIDVLPNRAHDCLSHDGVAREISTILALTLKDRSENRVIESPDLSPVEVRVEDEQLCRRYVSRRINNVSIVDSPQWIKDRLVVLDQRSINCVVDATNYIMLETGQPLHAFDADKVEGKISVRLANKGEMITTIDGDDIELSPDILVIADEIGVLAIAGVKGGKKAMVTSETKNLILESANFDPILVRRASAKTGIRTESSKRFENDLSSAVAGYAMDRVTDTILSLTGTDAVVSKVVDIHNIEPVARQITFSTDDVSSYLGVSIGTSDIETILGRLKFLYNLQEDSFTVMPPIERLDLNIKADMIEEVGRLYGYDRIPGQSFDQAPPVEVSPMFEVIKIVKDVLLSLGFDELYGYSFVKKGQVEVANPLAKDRPNLRTGLSPELLAKAKQNTAHILFDHQPVRVFEVGTAWPTKDSEEMHVAVAVAYKKAKFKKDDISISEAITSLSDRLGVAEIYNERMVDDISEVIEFNLTDLLNQIKQSVWQTGGRIDEYINLQTKFQDVSAYPRIIRDIAIFVPETTDPEDLRQAILSQATDLLSEGPVLFDDFVKDGRRSVAFRMSFQAHDRTLSDEEVNMIMNNICEAIRQNTDWQVRD